MRSFLGATLLLLGACRPEPVGPGDTAGGSDSGTDSGTDSDSATDSGTDSDSGTDTGSELAAELEAARAAWEACGYDSYDFVLEWRLFAGPEMTGPARIAVVDGVVVEATYTADGSPVEPSFDTRTVPELLDLVGEALARPADVVTVSWDPACGFPTDAYFDYELDSDDEELGFWLTGLSPTG